MECFLRQDIGNANVIKIFRLFFQLAIPLAAICFLFWWFSRIPAEVFLQWKTSFNWSAGSIFFLCLLMVLAFLNWALEARKWKLLCEKLENISFYKAFKGVLFGITLGMITPRRTGDFLGRAVILTPGNRVKGIMG
jgi:hypothetical protein